MEASVTAFLNGLSSKVFWLAAFGFIALNATAITVFFVTRSRRLVNEWTSKLVAADVALIAIGAGVPLVSGLLKIGVHAIASLFGGATPAR